MRDVFADDMEYVTAGFDVSIVYLSTWFTATELPDHRNATVFLGTEVFTTQLLHDRL